MGGSIGNTTKFKIDSPFDAGLYRAFAGTGSVVFGANVAEISPAWFYDDGGNWATAINKAIVSAEYGQRVKLPAGTLPIKATNASECILYNRPIDLIGAGRNSTILQVDSAVAATIDVLRVSFLNSGPYPYNNGVISDFTISALSGTPARNGIFLDTTVNTSQQINNLIIQRIRIDPLGKYGIFQDSNTGTLETFFNSIIRDNVIFNGIAFNRAGDTNRIENNELRGNNYGLYVNLVSGANQLNYTGNLSVNVSGGIFVQNAGNMVIENNQFEQQQVGMAGVKAQIVLSGATNYTDLNGAAQTNGAPIMQPTIAKNTFNLGNYDSGASNIYLDYVIGASLSKNRFNVGNSTTQSVLTTTANCWGADLAGDNFFLQPGATAQETWNNWRTAMRNTQLFKDSGVGTVGLYKVPTLLNSWTQVSDHTPVSFKKISNDLLSIFGSITGGTKTDGTVIFTLPAGFIPQLYVDLPVFAYNSSTGNGLIWLSVNPNTGDVVLGGANSTTTRISLDNLTLRLYR